MPTKSEQVVIDHLIENEDYRPEQIAYVGNIKDLGYDLIVAGPNGPRYIEIKRTYNTGSMFKMEPSQLMAAKTLGNHYWLYIVVHNSLWKIVRDPINRLKASGTLFRVKESDECSLF